MNALYSIGWILIGLLGMFLYVFRAKVTIKDDGRPGSILGAIVAFAVFAVIGYAIDAIYRISTILQYMYVAGGTLMWIAVFIIAGLITLFASMFYVNLKWGQVYA
ncbi:hypothetical protein DRJ25_05290 [Candidatus Woesearchaeota archaeon]|nr:MAG: hypothetical protein DRJ25_05290 [Candidatus Woesearchaeota archaeon]